MGDPEWGADIRVAVFDSADEASVRTEILEWLSDRVGPSDELSWVHSGMVACLTARSAVHGSVALRIYQPGVDIEAIERTVRLQSVMAAAGLPAAEPLANPAPLGNGTGVVETYVSAGADAENGWGPSVAQPMGATLARIGEIGARLHTEDLPPIEPRTETFEFTSHTSVFDFEATQDGAEWIESSARRAHELLHELPAGDVVVAHRDWRLGNVEVANRRVHAIYDWGSIQPSYEADAVGSAAIGFGAWWGRAGRKGGTVEEGKVFIAAYESRRDEPFSPGELRAAGAAAVMHLAYIARCEHSMGWKPEPGSASAALASTGPELLADGFGHP